MVLAWLVTMVVYCIAMTSFWLTMLATNYNESPGHVEDIIYVYTQTLGFDLGKL